VGQGDGHSAKGESVPLTHLRKGQTGVICEAKLPEDDAALLRAMGLESDSTVRLCRAGEPCIVAVGGVKAEQCGCGGTCRIGLSRVVAERIFVRVVG